MIPDEKFFVTLEDDIDANNRSRRWAFSSCDGLNIVWQNYASVGILLDWRDFLGPYIYTDASAERRRLWARDGWFPLACNEVAFDMRITQEALGFRARDCFDSAWLWRDQLIKWCVGDGVFPLMKQSPPWTNDTTGFPRLAEPMPMRGEPDLICVDADANNVVRSELRTPDGKRPTPPDQLAALPAPMTPRPAAPTAKARRNLGPAHIKF